MVAATVSDMTVTAKLPGGTVRSAGRIRDARTQSVRVTGGTGAYAGARGTNEVSTVNAGTGVALNVYRLQLP